MHFNWSNKGLHWSSRTKLLYLEVVIFVVVNWCSTSLKQNTGSPSFWDHTIHLAHCPSVFLRLYQELEVSSEFLNISSFVNSGILPDKHEQLGPTPINIEQFSFHKGEDLALLSLPPNNLVLLSLTSSLSFSHKLTIICSK